MKTEYKVYRSKKAALKKIREVIRSVIKDTGIRVNFYSNKIDTLYFDRFIIKVQLDSDKDVFFDMDGTFETDRVMTDSIEITVIYMFEQYFKKYITAAMKK